MVVFWVTGVCFGFGPIAKYCTASGSSLVADEAGFRINYIYCVMCAVCCVMCVMCDVCDVRCVICDVRDVYVRVSVIHVYVCDTCACVTETE